MNTFYRARYQVLRDISRQRPKYSIISIEHMIYAALNGNLDNMIWLRENRCPWNVLDVIRRSYNPLVILYVILEITMLRERNLMLKFRINHQVKCRRVLEKLSYIPAGLWPTFPGGALDLHGKYKNPFRQCLFNVFLVHCTILQHFSKIEHILLQ